VNSRPTTVVRLERPLALGHGQHSSSRWAPVDTRSLGITYFAMNRKPGHHRRASVLAHRSGSTEHGQHRTATAPRGDCTRVLIGREQVKLGPPAPVRAQAVRVVHSG
jgi:hypothetical protein